MQLFFLVGYGNHHGNEEDRNVVGGSTADDSKRKRSRRSGVKNLKNLLAQSGRRKCRHREGFRINSAWRQRAAGSFGPKQHSC